MPTAWVASGALPPPVPHQGGEQVQWTQPGAASQHGSWQQPPIAWGEKQIKPDEREEPAPAERPEGMAFDNLPLIIALCYESRNGNLREGTAFDYLPDNLPLIISPFDNPPLDHVDHRPIRTHPPNIRG